MTLQWFAPFVRTRLRGIAVGESWYDDCMTSIVSALTWTISIATAVILIAVVVLFYVVFYSLTWPWFIYRALRRIALPR